MSQTQNQPRAGQVSIQPGNEMQQPLQDPERDDDEGYCSFCPCRKWCTPCCMIITGLLLLAALIALIVALVSHGGGNKGPDGPLHCNVDHCTKSSVPDGAKSCAEAVCNECHDGYDQHKGACFFRCSADQKMAGCSPLGCSENNSCSGCVPGFTLQKAGENLRGPALTCTKASEPVKMNFLMYRAQNDENYAPESAVLASPAGVMWYLHNSVVALCQEGSRRNGISRVLRYNVTVHNPSAVFADRKGQFGHFVQFQWGKCTNPDCAAWWEQYGYAVGCQKQDSHHYSGATYFSLPGPCPNKDLAGKTDACKLQEPGGSCSHPDGSGNCTWSAELLGSVSLDELVGIKDIEAFCAAGNVEYNPKTDRGNGTDFWDGKANVTRNDERVSKLLQLFAKHYPNVDLLSAPSPQCDGL